MASETSLLFDPIGAGVSALGSLLSYKTAKKNREAQERMNQANIEMQRETNAQQYKMFQEGNQFNRQQALEMFNLENEYNTPEANKQRMLAAGLNPFADSGAVQPMQANTTPASSVSPPTLTAPRGVAPQMDTSFIRDFGNIASAFHSLASAKKEGVETHQLELTLEPRLKGMYLENEGKEITNKLNKVALDVQHEFAKPKAQAELANILESTQKLVSDFLLNESHIDVNNSLQYLYERQSDLIYSSKLLTDKQKELLEKELNNYDVRFALETALTRAQTYNQNSQGKQALSGAELNDSLRYLYDQKGQQELYNKFIKAETWTYEADILKKQFGITEQQSQQFDEMIQKAKNDNSAFWFEKAMDFLKAISPLAGAAVAGSIVKGVPLTQIKPQTIVTSTPAGTGALLGIP